MSRCIVTDGKKYKVLMKENNWYILDTSDLLSYGERAVVWHHVCGSWFHKYNIHADFGTTCMRCRMSVPDNIKTVFLLLVS